MLGITNSSWSNFISFFTSYYIDGIREYVDLKVRGTGSNNHNSSFVLLDEFILSNRSDYTGLHLTVLKRY